MTRRIRRWWNPPDELTKTHRHVRVAIMLAAFCLLVTFAGFVAWLRNNEQQAEQAAYQTAFVAWRSCTDRAAAGVQIDDVNDAAVSHAEDTAEFVAATAATFDEIVAVFEVDGINSERLVKLRRIVDGYNAEVAQPYRDGVNQYREAADAYVPQNPDGCPPQPDPPR
jgi:hypothetical protein